jgi:hypothetical protein
MSDTGTLAGEIVLATAVAVLPASNVNGPPPPVQIEPVGSTTYARSWSGSAAIGQGHPWIITVGIQSRPDYSQG